MTHLLIKQAQIIRIILLQALVEQRDILERIDVHRELSLVILRQHEVPLKIAFAVRHQLVDDVQKLLSLNDKHAHTRQIICRRAVIDRQIDDLTVFIDLHRQRLRVLAVCLSRLCHNRQITAGGDVRIDDLGKINRAQHGCIGQNDILRVAALQNRQRRLQRFELSAVRARVPRRIRRQETHILAQMQIPVLAVCGVPRS